MSLHKLSAGHGYDYLIRQVAAHDATHRGRTDLASYYEGRGETPGRWAGRGLAGIDGLEVGDVVTGEQMRLLFAEGRHPARRPDPWGRGWTGPGTRRPVPAGWPGAAVPGGASGSVSRSQHHTGAARPCGRAGRYSGADP